MANYQNNPTDYSFGNPSDFTNIKIGICVSKWNSEVTESLYEGAVQALLKKGCSSGNIVRSNVPGSFELPLACQRFAKREDIDLVIALGCVIQGETPHFTFICDAVANGITRINLDTGKPVIFGVLTTNTHQQALDRAGGKHGNKGEEAALSGLKMLV